MLADRPSRTAQFVATMRTLGAILPDEAQLVDDPLGARVAGRAMAHLAELARRRPAARPLLRATLGPMVLGSVLYLQVRTRVIDDVLRRFIDGGGTQVVLLGAGFDARAERLAPLLSTAQLFEIDHPATQRVKRTRFGSRARYLPWDFEHDPMASLGARLAAIGHHPELPTLTIWEGVTMYLTEPAIAATVAAIRDWSAPGSRLAFTYFERSLIDNPLFFSRLTSALVRRLGEPWRFGWEPRLLPDWLAAHDLRLVSDLDMAEAAQRLLPPRYARLIRQRGRHLAVAAPAGR